MAPLWPRYSALNISGGVYHVVVYPVRDEDDDDARWGGGVLEGEVEEPRVRVLDVGGTSGEFEVVDVGAIVGLRAERDEVDYESVVVFAEGAAEGAPHRGLVIDHGVAVVEDNADVHLRRTLKRGQRVSCRGIYRELKHQEGPKSELQSADLAVIGVGSLLVYGGHGHAERQVWVLGLAVTEA